MLVINLSLILHLIMQNYQINTLANGLRIIYAEAPIDVTYCGYVVKAGTRNEDLDDAGMAHFCEHLTFKGTERRRSSHIINRMERVGGDLNAYTSKEETVYYATFLKEDFSRAVDLLTDIVFHSTYPQNEITKEVEVIADEIDSYKDNPSELIFEEHESMLFRSHPLGREILGDIKRLRQYTTEDAQRFIHRYYQPSNCVFFVYGKINFNTVVKNLERATSDLPFINISINNPSLPLYIPEERIVERNTFQAHVILGNRTYSGSDKKRIPFFLLNNILGGPGMNSRLNVRLREHAGLVYNVESNVTNYTDTGVWNVYFGCDKKDINRCVRLVKSELKRFIDKPLSESQLQAAKKQLIGQLGVGMAQFESYAIGFGKSSALYNHVYDIEEYFDRIREVTAQQVQEIAATIFDEKLLTTLIYR